MLYNKEHTTKQIDFYDWIPIVNVLYVYATKAEI